MDKQAFRERVWETLTEQKLGAFPFPLKGRIPNFKGASAAAAQLFDSEIWAKTEVIKSNPDSPQRAVRRRALEDGKIVYMAVPRLTDRRCFIKLQVPPDQAAAAASIKGAFKYGQPVHPSEMQPVDLVVCGSVAVNARGQRIGKGGGYSDLELAIGGQFGLLGPNTVFVTTVHDHQVRDEDLPQQPHDVVLDWIFTPTRAIQCQPPRARDTTIHWHALSEEKRAAIPILAELEPGDMG